MRDRVSVIIATKDRPESLRSTLDSLTRHSPRQCQDIVLVDSSQPHTRNIVEETARTFGCRYMYEPRSGVSAAKNRAIRASIGEIVVNVDDDFLFVSDAISEMVKHFGERKIAACTGRMLPFQRDAAMLFERVYSYDRGTRAFDAVPSDMGVLSLIKSVGALGRPRLGDATPLPFKVGYGFSSFRKTILEDVGYFDETLGRGTSAAGGEDVDMFYKILKHGLKIRYEPKATIYHRHRLSHRDITYYAWASGRCQKAITSKYLTSDTYMFFLYLGILSFLALGSIRFSLAGSGEISELFAYQLRGLLGGLAPGNP